VQIVQHNATGAQKAAQKASQKAAHRTTTIAACVSASGLQLGPTDRAANILARAES